MTEVKVSLSTCAPEARGDGYVIVAGVIVFHTRPWRYVDSGAFIRLEKRLSQDVDAFEGHLDASEGGLAGPVLVDKDDNSYEIVLLIRRSYLIEENPIFYYYMESYMGWNKKDDATGTFDSLYNGFPFVIGKIEVRVNGRLVINRRDNRNYCTDSPYLWIPDHGIFHYDGKTFRNLYYLPYFFPIILS
ncbi:hypothetical protein Q1695_016405 [Nippostrongylus brasiliensis]|nr:hypothetical protein Q1695_016405 [Nippostrongylus brasiliensis]